jgi:hypothetical protein
VASSVSGMPGGVSMSVMLGLAWVCLSVSVRRSRLLSLAVVTQLVTRSPDFGRNDLPLRRSSHVPGSTVAILVSAGFLVVWLLPDARGFCSVLARKRHDQLGRTVMTIFGVSCADRREIGRAHV